MDEKDFARIEELFTKFSGEFSNKLDGLSEDVTKKLDAQSADLAQFAVHSEGVDKKLATLSEDLALLAVQGDRFQHKLDLVVEGYQTLSEKLDQAETSLSAKIEAVDEKLSKKIDDVDEKLGKKIDAVAADLSAHRTDTEAHHGIYRVKEEDEEFGK